MDLFDKYDTLCDRIFEVLVQENSLLKKGNPPTSNILDSKKNLLSELDPIVEKLKAINAISERDADITDKIKQKLMKIFIIDKENEKLLLELQTPGLAERRYSVSMSRLKSIYNKNNTQ